MQVSYHACELGPIVNILVLDTSRQVGNNYTDVWTCSHGEEQSLSCKGVKNLLLFAPEVVCLFIHIEEVIRNRGHRCLVCRVVCGEFINNVLNIGVHSYTDFPFLGKIQLHAKVVMDFASVDTHLA